MNPITARITQTVEKVGVCTSHFIPYDTLYAYVLSRLQYWSSAVQVDPDAILEQLKNASDSDGDATRKRLTSDLKAAEKRIAKLDSMIAKLYEDRLSETLNERTFAMLTQKYQNEQDELAAKIETMTQQLEAMKQQSDGAQKWVELVKQYSTITELNAEILNALIEKIVVHEAEKDSDGTRKQEVEIFYRFVGKVDI